MLCLFLAKGDDMSIKAMTWVWDNSTQKSTNLLMLLAIADFCNDEGICYPSVPRLAKKCRLQERGARKVIFKLQDVGEITVVVGGHGGKKKGRYTNLYYLNGYRQSLGLSTQSSLVLRNTPVPQDRSTPVLQDRSTPVPQDRSTPVPQDSQTINIDPSIDPSVKKHTHTALGQFRESENSHKKSERTFDDLNDFEKAAWKWAQSENFWKGRITTIERLETHLEDKKPFRVQFEQVRSSESEQSQSKEVPKPVNGKKAQFEGKRMTVAECPYCNERGMIDIRDPDGNHFDVRGCPHNHEAVKELANKKKIFSAQPGYEDPAQRDILSPPPANAWMQEQLGRIIKKIP